MVNYCHSRYGSDFSGLPHGTGGFQLSGGAGRRLNRLAVSLSRSVQHMRTSRLLWTTMCLAFAPVLFAGHSKRIPLEARAVPSGDPSVANARLPLSFEPNEGQTDRRVRFLARGPGYTLFLTADEAVLSLRCQESGVRSQEQVERPLSRVTHHQSLVAAVVRLKLVGADPGAKVTGEEELPGKSNYFLGNDPGGWHTDVPTYAKVRYQGLYRGVDAVYYGRQGKLEYDFRVAPGVDPGRVRLRIEGAEKVGANGARELVLETPGGKVVLGRPEAYQGSGARRRTVAVQYVRRGRGEYGFTVGNYSKGEPLIIDPFLSYSTYLGGSGGDVAYAVGVDSSGNTYIAGFTNSTDFPTAKAEQSKAGGNGDAFISKLNPAGTAFVYSTYLGGSGADIAAGLAVDAAGDVFLTGQTTSSDFPVSPKSSSSSSTQAFQTVYGGEGDAFAVELASAGDKLVYSSYLGGSGADFGQAIAVDSSGNAYVAGSTQSTDFPTVNPIQPNLAGGTQDVFIAKVNFSGTALVYSSYLGGAQADTGQAIKVDASGNAYIAGYTFSPDFPTEKPIQGSLGGDADAFVTEVNAAGSALVFSTYLGGAGRDRAFGLALDTSGNIYVAGDTQSTNFPTTSGAFQTSNAGNGDAFVSKLSPSGASLAYSTYLGGSGVDQANAIAVDSSGNAVVVGFTQSSDFPKVDPLQAILNGPIGGSTCGTSPCADAFVSELKASGSQLAYSTFLGGSQADFGQAVALDTSGNPRVVGSTSSSNFPAVAGAFQGNIGGVAGNAFVVEIQPADSPALALAPSKLNFGNQTVSVTSTPSTVNVINAGSAPLQITAITPPSSDFTETNQCVGTVSPGGTCPINVQFTPTATGSVTDRFTIADNAAGSPHTFTVTGAGVTAATAVTVAPTSLSFGNQAIGSVSAVQTVTITNTGTATLVISTISASGDFKETNNCGALNNALNVGQSCSVSVTFAPTATGLRSGTLSISDNATGSPQSVALSGNGLAQFSLSANPATVSTVIGSTSATFKVSASAPSNFTGSISLACSTGATCTFNPTSIFTGQSSTLTVSGLSASTPSPDTFTVTGTSGSQVASLNLTVLLQTFTLSASPALNTIVPGASANYTVLATPVYGFNQQIKLGCSNLPAGAGCSFSSSSPTLSGSSSASIALTITTTKGASSWRLWPGGPPSTRLMLLLSFVGLVFTLKLLANSWRLWRGSPSSTLLVAPRAILLAVLLCILLFLASCRGVSPVSSSSTPIGNYIITITGTLSSNTAVSITSTVDLSVT
jgi:beta-propeller repeat-containing protein/HYDIN/CFA65/VesB family protein/centrosomal CEP192-like protein